jgi:tRNA (guanine-N7-)-methyltransferase
MPRIKQQVLDEMQATYDNVNLFKDKEFLKSLSGKWNDTVFNTDNPIALEVGMGNGAFLQQLIAYNEEQEESFNYIGLEIKEFRIWKSLKKNAEHISAGLLKLINARAHEIEDFFAHGEVQRIYLNFSDPWPKDRHAKHRLTSPTFLPIYKKILTQKGDLFIKTDNQGLYEYSLETLPQNGFEVLKQSEDLHATDFLTKNFVTEFESKFLVRGKTIYYIHAQRRTS